MKVILNKKYISDLNRQVSYISKDKPLAAKKFKQDLILNLKKDLQFPFHFKKSIYFENELIRDYIFKGYTSVYRINEPENTVELFGFIKHKNRLILFITAFCVRD